MDLYFLDKNRELVGIIDVAQSIQWLERYYEVGTFEVYVQISDDVLNIVNQSYFIARNDSKFVGVIEYIGNEEDADNGNFLIIQGKMAESLLGRRIIRNITYLTTTLFAICRTLLKNNILNPVLQEGEKVSPRKMICLNEEPTNKLANNPILETQATFENNLLTFIQDLLKSYNASIRLELQEDNKFKIIIYDGVDRSYAQETNPYITFSKTFDNLLSSEYKINSQNEANAIYVGGEDNETASEGRFVDKYELSVGSGVVSDLDRKEVFVNASDLKQTWKDDDETEHNLTTEEYRALLQARGKENVVEPTESLTADVDITMYEYGKDYFLGDIVTIENELMGRYTNKRLIGMDVVDDENGHTLNPIFEE